MVSEELPEAVSVEVNSERVHSELESLSVFSPPWAPE